MTERTQYRLYGNLAEIYSLEVAEGQHMKNRAYRSLFITFKAKGNSQTFPTESIPNYHQPLLPHTLDLADPDQLSLHCILTGTI